MARQALARCGLICCLLYLTAFGPAHAALPIFEQPEWIALTDEQKSVLTPLHDEWQTMDAFRRKKWIGIANRYAGMSEVEQASIQRNMKEWAKLSSDERKLAREQYRKLKKIEPEKRQAVKREWEEYSALPQVTREHMRDIAPRKPQVKSPEKLAAKPQGNPAIPATTAKRSPISPMKPPQSPLVPKQQTKPPAQVQQQP